MHRRVEIATEPDGGGELRHRTAVAPAGGTDAFSSHAGAAFDAAAASGFDLMGLQVNPDFLCLLTTTRDLYTREGAPLNTAILWQEAPLTAKYMRRAGLIEASTSRAVVCFLAVFLNACSAMFFMTIMLYGFGVPLGYALSYPPVLWMPMLLTWLGFATTIDEAMWLTQIKPFKYQFEVEVKKRRLCTAPVLVIFFICALAGYFSMRPMLVADGDQTGTMRSLAIAAIVGLGIMIPVPCTLGRIPHALNVVLDSFFTTFPRLPELVDTYCFALKRAILNANAAGDGGSENAPQAGRDMATILELERLHRNFDRLLHFQRRSNMRWETTFIQVFLAAGIVLSVSMVVSSAVGSELDDTSKVATVVVGILCSLITMSYLSAMMQGAVSLSLRWEQCILSHLSGPHLAVQARSIGLCASQEDFHFYLVHKHDVRGIFLRTKVSHHTVQTVLSALTSAIAIIIGYGVRSLI